MKHEIDLLKGLHPGLYLDRKIRERKLTKSKLALDCHEYPQTLTAITKGKRDMNTGLSLKLERELGLEEGMLMTLQVFHDIKKEKRKQENAAPDLKLFRKSLFWDTDIALLNWQEQYRYIITRIYERGNENEKTAIKNFYGQNLINEVLSSNQLKPKRKRL
jgi:plasmid maintenance system antidote protein VapI